MEAFRAKVCQYGECFYGLSEAHFVADNDLALDEREAGPEALIAAQRSREMLSVKLQLAHGKHDVIR